MNILDKLKGKKPPQMAEVEITRNTRARLPDGRVISVSPGQVLDLEKCDADALVAAHAAERIYSDAEKAEHDRIRKLIPPPHDPRPLPEGWDKLPDCFAKWWSLAERLRCLRGRQIEIEACVIRGHGLTEEEAHWMRHDVEAQGGEHGQRVKLVDSWLQAHPLRIMTPTDQELADLSRLRGALQRQGEAIDDFLAEHKTELVTLKLECGALALKANGRHLRASRELAEVGFQIFRSRVVALGVHDDLIRKWFTGSADSIRFTFPAHKAEGQRFAYLDHETGERIVYIDKPVEALATWLPRWEAEAARLEKLLKEARAELAKAQSVKPEPMALPS